MRDDCFISSWNDNWNYLCPGSILAVLRHVDPGHNKKGIYSLNYKFLYTNAGGGT